MQAPTDDPAAPVAESLSMLRGKRVVCVGGRPGSNRAIRRIAETAGGELTLHDGVHRGSQGLAGRRVAGRESDGIPGRLRRPRFGEPAQAHVRRQQIAYYPLRTASVASFVELIGRLDAHARAVLPTDTQAGEASRFCLRHA
ncbi:hypothetical protein [Burkholderia sp. AW49-1]